MSLATHTYPGLKDFKLQELVPFAVYEQYKSQPLFLTALFDKNALLTLAAVRRAFGPTTVNTWHTQGVERGHQYRGYRPLDCKIGALTSMHKLGKAFDCSFKDVTADEARQYILANPAKFTHLSAMELDVPWLHFDVRHTGKPGVMLFKP